MTFNTLAFGWPGGLELAVVGVIALLIFGRRLPDVARSVGKSIVEFKRGLRDVKDDIDMRAQIGSSSEKPLDNDEKSEPVKPAADEHSAEPKS